MTFVWKIRSTRRTSIANQWMFLGNHWINQALKEQNSPGRWSVGRWLFLVGRKMTTCCVRCFHSFNPCETWFNKINSKRKGSVDLYIESYPTLGILRTFTSLFLLQGKLLRFMTSWPPWPQKISSHKSMLHADPGSTRVDLTFAVC